MLTLTYGYKQPQTGDKGGGVNGFWVALENDIAQLDSHSHNGVNSAKLTSSSVTTTTQAITAVGWVASGSGFRQLVTMPGALLYDDYFIEFKESVTKDPMKLGVERASANTYYVYINDSSLALVAYYLS